MLEKLGNGAAKSEEKYYQYKFFLKMGMTWILMDFRMDFKENEHGQGMFIFARYIK